MKHLLLFLLTAALTGTACVPLFSGSESLPPLQPTAPPTTLQPMPAPTLPPLPANNLLYNGDVESTAGWEADHWGNLQAQLQWVAADDAFSAQAYLRTEVHDFVDGDAKWLHKPVTLASGWYEYQAAYRSDGRNRLIWSCTRPDGRRSFYTAGQTHATESWQTLSLRFYISPEQADCAVQVMQVLDRPGWIHSDYHSLQPVEAQPLQRPLISISFDDIWSSAATHGAEALARQGWKGSFYVAGNFVRSGETEHANPEQVRALQQQGHEIGSHSESHALMTELRDHELLRELWDHHQYLSWLGIQPSGMAYPFGDFDQRVETETQRFHAYARTSLTGLNDRLTNPYRLKIFPVTAETSTLELKRWVDDAQRTATWLILLFHDLSDTPSDYFYTTRLSQYHELLAYIATQELAVLTVAEALREVQAQRLSP